MLLHQASQIRRAGEETIWLIGKISFIVFTFRFEWKLKLLVEISGNQFESEFYLNKNHNWVLH